MKKDIHPTYYPNARVICACGNTWVTGSTQEEIRTDVCSQCHPFFTGQAQRIVDSAGQVERFNRRIEQARNLQAQEEKRGRSRAEREAARRLVELVDEEEAVEPIEGLIGEEQAEEAQEQA
jgi:large subunit ribosomal protein L31